MNEKPISETLAVVVRYTDFPSVDAKERIALKAAYRTYEEADAEAERLNSLTKGDLAQDYFVLSVKYYPEGRYVSKGY